MSDNISQDVNIEGEGNIVIGKARDVIFNPLPPAEARLRHDLGILLKNVQNTWIRGVLEKSVYEAALLELGMELREEAVDNPWRMVMEGPDQPRQPLPRGRKIKDIFDEANRLLLILGEPGSGKTTTLLQLARDLIAEVDQAFTQPVPVIFNLSAWTNWTNKQQPLADWLIAELNSKYRLPKKDGRRWLKERRILPLLDGLDEVKVENRAACVEKINRLVRDYGLQGLVVCSRIKDYTDLNVHLAFYRAIYLQPLTPEQVEEYLDQAGDKLASLRATLRSDEALRSMAQSPLILNIMSLAYQNTSAEDLSDPALATDKARRQHLFDTYIARMFNRKAGTRPYDDEQTRQRLSWLARNMQRRDQEVFLIEGLQPSWLSTRVWQWVDVFASRLMSGLIFGLIFWLISESSGWLSAGLIIGVPVGFIDVLRFEWLRKKTEIKRSLTFWWSVINIVIVWLIYGLIVWLIVRLVLGSGLRPLVGPLFGLLGGLPAGLIFGLRGSQQSPESDVQAVEALHWSWRKALKGGLIGGLSGMLIVGLSGWVLDGLDAGLIDGLQYGPIGGFIGANFSGLSREIVQTKSVPNQGIRLSIRNAIFGGMVVGLATAVSIALFLGVRGGLDRLTDELIINALRDMLLIGRVLGLIGVFWYGGLDVIQHYTLRLILIVQGHTPANYARFLDYVVDRIFLQKVGGGYRFIHRLLLEHFADMCETRKA